MPIQQGGPRLQTSAVNPPPPISALLPQQDVIPLQPSAVRNAPPPPPLSVSIQGGSRPPPPTSVVCAHAPLISDLIPEKVEPPLQRSAVNPPPLPNILAFPLQRDVPHIQPLSACASLPHISVLLQGRRKSPLLPSILRDYFPLLSAFILWQGVPLCQSSTSLILFFRFKP